jgi:hypothetical protein
MKQFITCILFTTLYFSSLAQSPRFIGKEKIFTHLLGDKKVIIKTISFGTNTRTVLINLHHNENTSLEAAKKVLEQKGGLLINIENDNERFIEFSQKGQTFRFDPNRMFTDAGIRQDLELKNDRSTATSVKAIKKFARYIRAKIPASATTVIALHNNDDGNLSVASYLPGGDYAREASSVHQQKQQDQDNFFLTTDARLYQQLSRAGYNVVMQHNRRATDDGSLSIYYGRRKKSYVNVEAETGKLEDQQRMLEVLIRLIGK